MVEENAEYGSAIVREEVYAALRMAYDPLYAINVLEMGLIDHVTIDAGTVTVALLKPYQDARSCADLIQNVTSALQRVMGVESCAVSFVASPLWDTTMLSHSLRHMFGLDSEEHGKKKRYYHS